MSTSQDVDCHFAVLTSCKATLENICGQSERDTLLLNAAVMTMWTEDNKHESRETDGVTLFNFQVSLSSSFFPDKGLILDDNLNVL